MNVAAKAALTTAPEVLIRQFVGATLVATYLLQHICDIPRNSGRKLLQQSHGMGCLSNSQILLARRAWLAGEIQLQLYDAILQLYQSILRLTIFESKSGRSFAKYLKTRIQILLEIGKCRLRAGSIGIRDYEQSVCNVISVGIRCCRTKYLVLKLQHVPFSEAVNRLRRQRPAENMLRSRQHLCFRKP